MSPHARTQAVYVISVAAELAGMHPQTLAHLRAARARAPGPHRRAATAATATPTSRRLRRISELAEQGMNLEGIRRVMELETENERLSGRAGGGPAPSAEQASTKAREAAQLVPLKQALAVFGERPAFLRERDDQSDA